MKNVIGFSIIALLLCCRQHAPDELQVGFNWLLQPDFEDQGKQQSWYAASYTPCAPVQLSALEDINTILDDTAGIVWYFSDFKLNNPPRKTALACENIDDAATFWLNGLQIAQHQGANQEVKFDISDQIQKGNNRLTVRLENHGGPGGLLGSVSLISFKTEEDLLRGKYNYAEAPDMPDWAEHAVIYEVNVRQYTPEGTFKAFESHLPRLQKLGVKILWFMPIHPIGEKNRKGTLGSYYSIRDYYGINPEFGTLEDFKDLVRKIHEMDMYVLIDLVANHTAWDHPLIEQHPEWYTQDENGDIVAPVEDWSDVADLNYDNSELRQYMIEMMSYWVRETDIDGYRCDVAELVPNDFWGKSIAELRKIKPVFMLAEGQHPSLHAHGFNASYAFNLYWLFNDLAVGKRSSEEIDMFLTMNRYKYPPGSRRMFFTSNHDQNTWHGSAVKRLGPAAEALAVLTFTLPGMPLIYNGQEIGFTQQLEFFEKDEIEWQSSPYETFYNTLCSAYRNHESLNNGDIKRLETGDTALYAFVRSTAGESALVIANLSSSSLNLEFPLEGLSGTFVDIFAGNELTLSGDTLTVELNGWEYRIYISR